MCRPIGDADDKNQQVWFLINIYLRALFTCAVQINIYLHASFTCAVKINIYWLIDKMNRKKWLIDNMNRQKWLLNFHRVLEGMRLCVHAEQLTFIQRLSKDETFDLRKLAVV